MCSLVLETVTYDRTQWLHKSCLLGVVLDPHYLPNHDQKLLEKMLFLSQGWFEQVISINNGDSMLIFVH